MIAVRVGYASARLLLARAGARESNRHTGVVHESAGVDVEEDDVAALGGEAEEEEQDDGLRFQQKQMTTEELTACLAALEAPAAMASSTFSGMVVDQGHVLAIDSLQNTQADLASMLTTLPGPRTPLDLRTLPVKPESQWGGPSG